MKKYNLIKISTFENRKFEDVKEIDQIYFDKVRKDSEILKHVYTQFVIFKNLQLNLKDYSSFLDKITDISTDRANIKIIHHPDLLLKANQVILNFLSSFKFFLDNGESYLKRKYGKHSNETNSFLKLISQEFDNYFAYRFLIKLRNYSIHLGFPLQGLMLKAEKFIDIPGETLGSIQLLIDIDLIKKEKNLLGSIVYNDIKELTENIDLKPLIYDVSISIINIQKHVINIQKEQILNAISNLEERVGRYKTKSNDLKVIHNYQKIGKTLKFNAYHIPFEIIDELKNYIKTSANNTYT